MSIPQLGYQYIRPLYSSERHGVGSGLAGTELSPSGTLSNVLSTMYGSPFATTQGYGAFLPYSNDVAILNQLGAQYELKESPGIQHPGFSHPHQQFYPYGQYQFGDPSRPKNATRESTSTLKAWLSEHRKNPYPTKGEKIMLAIITKMTLTQVSTWFANARRRLKKENKMTWVPKSQTDEEGNVYTSDNEGEEGDKREDDEEIDLENIDTESIENKDDSDDQDDLNSDSKLIDRSDSEVSDGYEDVQGPNPRFLKNVIKESRDIGANGDKRVDSHSLQIKVSSGELNQSRVSESLENNTSPPLKPKIWSLAETATAPDNPRKSPQLHRNSGPATHTFMASQKPLSCSAGKLPNWTKMAFSAHQIALTNHYLGLANQASANSHALYRHTDGKNHNLLSAVTGTCHLD